MRKIGTRITAFCLGILMILFSSGIPVLAEPSAGGMSQFADSGREAPLSKEDEFALDSGTPPDDTLQPTVIDRFEVLAEEDGYLLVLPGTEFEELNFPGTLTAYSKETRLAIPVTWACANYDPSAEPNTAFTVSPVLPEEFLIAEGTELPVIYVLFSAAAPLAINDRIYVEEVIYKVINPDTVQLIGVTERFAGGNLVIPDTVTDAAGKQYAVSSIEYGAFRDNTKLTAITIPNSVTKIADYAFSGCKALAELQFSKGLKTVGSWAFADTPALASITVPSGVQFGSYAFARAGVSSLAFEEGNLSLGTYIFSECPNLKQVTIPANFPWTGQSAFKDSALESVTIGEGVTELGDHAFSYCTNLKTVQFAQKPGAEGLKSIWANAFEYCSSLVSIEIPNTVSELGYSVFFNCTALVSATLPTSAQTLPPSFFYRCDKLAEITIPANYSSIGGSAFGYCINLKTVNLEQGIQSLGTDAFIGCSSLEDIKLPDSVTTLGNGVFQLSGLKTIVLSPNLSSIPFATFSACENLTAIEIPEKVSLLGQYAFQLTGLTEINLPVSITTIGDECFLGTPLTAIEIPPQVTYLSLGVFQDCEQLESIVIPASIRMVNERAFFNCTSLTSIRILGPMYPPATGKAGSVGTSAFEGINSRNNAFVYVLDAKSAEAVFESGVNMDKIRYLNGDPTDFVPFVIDGATYEVIDPVEHTARIKKVKNVIGNFVVPGQVTEPVSKEVYTVTEIGGGAFAGNQGMKSITISNTVQTIQGSAFQDCRFLSSVVLPDRITEIPYNAFQGCTNLSAVNLPVGVKSIGHSAFRSCGITEVTLPNGIEVIGGYAFSNMPLQKVNLPEGLKQIGEKAFYDTKLQSITTPKSLEFLGEDAFMDNYQLLSVVIQGSPRLENGIFKNSYRISSAVLPDVMQKIPSAMFYNCGNLVNVQMPSSCGSIETKAFAYCRALKSIELPSNVNSIGAYAFQETALEKVALPNSVRWLGNGTYQDCTALKEATLSDSLESMGHNVFSGCQSLTSLALPKGLEAIPEEAFFGCSSLETVTIAEGPIWVGPKAFSDCKITSLILPGTVQMLYGNAFSAMSHLGSVKILGNKLTLIERNAFPVGTKLIANDPAVQLLLVEYLNQTDRPATTWDGKSSIPDGAIVTLEEDTVITGSVTIGREAELTILMGKTLTIKGTVTMGAGSTIKVQDEGKVFVLQSGQVTGSMVEDLPLQYELTVETGENGTASAEKQFLFGGETARVTTQPDNGYGTKLLLADGKPVRAESENSYEFAMPHHCTTVLVEFDQIAGLVTIAGPEHARLAEGESAEYRVSLPEGLEADRVRCVWSAEPASAVILSSMGSSVNVQAASLGRETPVTLTLSVTVGSSQYAVQTDVRVLRGKLQSIRLLPSGGVSLGLGFSQQMTLETVPKNYDAIFFWTSTAPKSVAVDQTGVATAVAPGSAKIRAAAYGVSSNEATVSAFSNTVYATGIELSTYDVTLARGATATVGVTLLPTNVTVRGGWTSADTQIATVDQNGTVRGIRPGRTVIAYSVEKSPQAVLRKEVQVTVTENTVTGIAIAEKPDGYYRVNSSLQLTARMTPDYAENKQVRWSSSKPSVATVDENGRVTIQGAGVAEITVISVAVPGMRASVKIIGAVEATGELTYQGGGKAAYKSVSLSGEGVLPTSSYTDENGKFRFGALRVGTYTLVSEPYVSGYNRVQATVTIAEGAKTAEWRLEYPKCDTGGITLRFRDTQGKAVPGVRASVQCVGPYQYQAGFAGDDGTLAFQGLSCNDRGVSYQINYSTADGAFGERSIALKTLEPDMTLDFVVPSVATVSGKVVDIRGVGVSGVYVALDKFGAYTNANGTYAIRGAIAEGSYPIRLSEKEVYYPLKEQTVAIPGGVDVQVPDYVVSQGIGVSVRLLLGGRTDTYKKAYLSLYDENNVLLAGGYASGADGCGFDGVIKRPGTYRAEVVNIFDQDGYKTIRFEAEPVLFQVTSMEQERVALQLEAMPRMHPSEVFSGDGNVLATNVQVVQKNGKFDVIGRYRNNSSQRVTAVFHTEFLNAVADPAYSGTDYTGKDFTVTLEPGDEERFLIKARVTDETVFAASVQTTVTLNGETFDFGRCGVEVVGVSLEARSTSIGLNQSAWVYGEATPGSTIRIFDKKGSLLASTKLDPGMGRWFTAELEGFGTEGVHQVYALADYNNEVANSETLSFTVSAKPVAVERVTVDQLSYEDLPINPRIDVRTFSHALDAAMRPSPLTVRTTLTNSEVVTAVTYRFAEHSFPAMCDGNGRWTANLEGWRGTGIKRLTAEIETADGRSFHLVIAEVTVLVDPSGTITDADTGAPLAGALVTCYQAQGNGQTWEVWDGARHGMVNPWVTGEDGRYGWDVETGLYKIGVEKDGYEPGTSSSIAKYREGIHVPPPALDVNLALVPTTSMRLMELTADDHSVTAQFSRYVRSASVQVTGPDGETFMPKAAISGATIVLTGAFRPNMEYTVQFETVLPHSGTKEEYRISSLTQTVKTAAAQETVSGNASRSTLTFPFSSYLNLAESAVKQAPREGNSVVLTFNGNPSVTGEELSKALSALNFGEKLRLRNMKGKEVSYQYTIDTGGLTTLPVRLEFGAELEDKATERLFERYYPGGFAAIRLAQDGAFGFIAEFAARVDLTGLDTSKLRVYRYDAKTNAYFLLTDAHPWVDRNGYTHMQLTEGGRVVLTDRPIGG